MSDILSTLQHRLRGHTCYDGCEDLLCLAAREIEALTEKVGHLTVEEFRLRQWLCPHRNRMKPDRGNDDGARQCADCAGIILDPERVALERAERAEALLLRLANEASGCAELARECIGNTNTKCLLDKVAEARALLADLDARRQS